MLEQLETGTSRTDWASKVDPRLVVPARSLETTSGATSPASGRVATLADIIDSAVAGRVTPLLSGGCTPLGAGVYGKVETYLYHGAPVAVKELKAGADEDSIGNTFAAAADACPNV